MWIVIVHIHLTLSLPWGASKPERRIQNLPGPLTFLHMQSLYQTGLRELSDPGMFLPRLSWDQRLDLRALKK